MSAKKTLAREPTVLMSKVVEKKQDKAKDEIIEFVYNSSHIWSKRNPERAKDCFDSNVVSYGWTEEPLKGDQLILDQLGNYYDMVDNLHFNVEDVHHEGDLNKGTIVVQFAVTGDSIRVPIENMPPTGAFTLRGCYIWTVQGRKVVETRLFYDFGSTTPFLFTIMAERRERLASKQ